MGAVKENVLTKRQKAGRFFLRWEMLLIYLLIVLNLVLLIMRPDLYLKPGTLASMIQSGLNICPLVLGMSLIMMMGDVDVSCTANMVVCAYMTGKMMESGVSAVIAIPAGLAACVLLGAVNGFLVAYMGMPAVITTIATSLLYRGMVRVALGTNVLRIFPDFYSKVMWENIAGIPICMILYLLMAAVFVVLLHKSRYGRTLYMIGNNATTAEYSGINVRRIKLLTFMIMGFMAGLASIFYIGRLGGGAQSATGTGDEMTVIAITALGGVSAAGGSGGIYGPVIATFIMAVLKYSLSLLGMDDNGRKIFTGIILIIAVIITSTKRGIIDDIKENMRRKTSAV